MASTTFATTTMVMNTDFTNALFLGMSIIITLLVVILVSK